jgi:uncharacterized membrane protein YphA (DoxX/SURF4 family)
MWNDFAVEAARVAIGLVLAIAGLAKLLDRSGFTRWLNDIKLLPPRMAPTIALALPVSELSIGGLLLAGADSPAVLCVPLVLFGVFTVGVARTIARGAKDRGCHCFTSTGGALGWRHVLRNLGLLALASAVLFTHFASILTLVGLGCVIPTLIPRPARDVAPEGLDAVPDGASTAGL